MEEKIRFATAILDFSIRKGGAERYLIDLCSRMAKDGHEVHVYTERWDEEIPGIFMHKVDVIPFPKSLKLLSFAIKATKEIKKGSFDITLGVGNTLEADILQPHGGVHWAWFWRSLRAYDNPVLWVIKFLGRILSPRQWIQGYIESFPFRKKRFKKIIAISEMIKRDIIRWYNVEEEKIEVVYNGVDIEKFNPKNQRFRDEIRNRYGIGNEFLILFSSNNFRMKGLNFLIKAISELKKSNSQPFKLLILGRDNPNSFFRLAKRIGIEKEIIFAGETKEPEKYYGASDLLIHPTFYDACSLTVLEALASGLPVITTSLNGASGILKLGQGNIILDDPRDIKSMIDSINIFFDRDFRKKTSFVSRQLAESYCLEKNWREMKKVFLIFNY